MLAFFKSNLQNHAQMLEAEMFKNPGQGGLSRGQNFGLGLRFVLDLSP